MKFNRIPFNSLVTAVAIALAAVVAASPFFA